MANAAAQLWPTSTGRRAGCVAEVELPAPSLVEVLMVAIAARPAPVPGLPPYDPDQSMSLAAACRLGLVPGHDGRRATTAEVRRWALTGFAVGPLGPSYLFPTAR